MDLSKREEKASTQTGVSGKVCVMLVAVQVRRVELGLGR
jgi:hypothetical protein